jgi:hypothetical protein
MASKTALRTKERTAQVGERREGTPQGDGMLVKPADANSDKLTPAEAKRLRQSLKQAKLGKTRPWSELKHELDL